MAILAMRNLVIGSFMMAFPFSINATIFLARPLIDLNPVLSIFSDCLLHLTAFEAFLFYRDRPKRPLVQLEEELVSFNLPVIFSRRSINWLSDSSLSNHYTFQISENNSMAYTFSPKPPFQTCAVQMYFNYDLMWKSFEFAMTSRNMPFCELGCQFIPRGHQYLLFPQISCLSKSSNKGEKALMCPYELSDVGRSAVGFGMYHTLEKHGVFQILFLKHDSHSDDSSMIFNWAKNVGSESVRPSAVSNEFVRLLITINSSQMNHASIYFENTCHDYATHKIYLGLDAKRNRKKIETYEWFIPMQQENPNIFIMVDLNYEMFTFENVSHAMHTHFSDILKHDPRRIPSFREFETWMSSNIMSHWAMYGNLTFIEIDTCYDKKDEGKPGVIVGTIYFEHEDSSKMAVYEEGLDFLTCGGVEQGRLSLIGYISAFDKWIWVWSLLTIACTMMLFMMAMKSSRNSSSKCDLLEHLLMPIHIALEQGNDVAGNEDGEPYLYFISGAWLITIIVMTNAYKGQNITDLTQPIPPVKPEDFMDLVDQNFAIKVKPCITFAGMERLLDIISFGSTDDSSMNGEKGNMFSKLLDQAEESDIVNKYRQIEKQVENMQRPEWLQMISSGGTGVQHFARSLKFCENEAFMSWTGEVKEARHLLKNVLRNERNYSEEKVNSIVSTSNDQLIPTRKGWTLVDVVTPIKSVLWRMSAVHESGIAKEWKEWDIWLKTRKYLIDFERGNGNDPVKLTTNDNIVVVFYVHLVLISVCIVIFITEKRRNLRLVFQRLKIACISIMANMQPHKR